MLGLFLEAQVENVAGIHPVDTEETPFEYIFRIQCTSCRSEHEKPVNINRFETHEMSGSRGEASFVFRCKMCKRESSATITATKQKCDGPKCLLLTMDCRGLEFVEFIPEGYFACVGTESSPGTQFNEVDLSEGEWFDYDEKAGLEVSITECKWSIENVK